MLSKAAQKALELALKKSGKGAQKTFKDAGKVAEFGGAEPKIGKAVSKIIQDTNLTGFQDKMAGTVTTKAVTKKALTLKEKRAITAAAKKAKAKKAKGLQSKGLKEGTSISTPNSATAAERNRQAKVKANKAKADAKAAKKTGSNALEDPVLAKQGSDDAFESLPTNLQEELTRLLDFQLRNKK